MNPEFRPECALLLGPLRGSRCSPAATQIPSPPLAERTRERRPLRSTYQRAGLEDDRARSGLWTTIAQNSKGLLSPALASRGGEGETPAHRSGGGPQLAHPRRTTGDELAGTYWVLELSSRSKATAGLALTAYPERGWRGGACVRWRGVARGRGPCRPPPLRPRPPCRRSTPGGRSCR